MKRIVVAMLCVLLLCAAGMAQAEREVLLLAEGRIADNEEQMTALGMAYETIAMAFPGQLRAAGFYDTTLHMAATEEMQAQWLSGLTEQLTNEQHNHGNSLLNLYKTLEGTEDTQALVWIVQGGDSFAAAKLADRLSNYAQANIQVTVLVLSLPGDVLAVEETPSNTVYTRIVSDAQGIDGVSVREVQPVELLPALLEIVSAYGDLTLLETVSVEPRSTHAYPSGLVPAAPSLLVAGIDSSISPEPQREQGEYAALYTLDSAQDYALSSRGEGIQAVWLGKLLDIVPTLAQQPGQQFGMATVLAWSLGDEGYTAALAQRTELPEYLTLSLSQHMPDGQRMEVKTAPEWTALDGVQTVSLQLEPGTYDASLSLNMPQAYGGKQWQGEVLEVVVPTAGPIDVTGETSPLSMRVEPMLLWPGVMQAQTQGISEHFSGDVEWIRLVEPPADSVVLAQYDEGADRLTLDALSPGKGHVTVLASNREGHEAALHIGYEVLSGRQMAIRWLVVIALGLAMLGLLLWWLLRPRFSLGDAVMLTIAGTDGTAGYARRIVIGGKGRRQMTLAVLVSLGGAWDMVLPENKAALRVSRILARRRGMAVRLGARMQVAATVAGAPVKGVVLLQGGDTLTLSAGGQEIGISPLLCKAEKGPKGGR